MTAVACKLRVLLTVSALVLALAALQPLMAGKIYWADPSVGIQRSNIDGTEVELLVSTLDAVDIAIDPHAGKMYWVESNLVRRANLDGAAVEQIVEMAPQRSLQAIALDLQRDQVYWTRAGKWPYYCPPDFCSGYSGAIHRADLDGSDQLRLWSGPSCPFNLPESCELVDAWGIALDPANDLVYVSDGGTGKIMKGVIVTEPGEDDSLDLGRLAWVDLPRGIALDLPGGKILWGDHNSLQRANLDGSGIETLVPESDDVWGVVLDPGEGKVYWSVSAEGAIRRADLDGFGAEDVLTGLSDPRGIALHLSDDDESPDDEDNDDDESPDDEDGDDDEGFDDLVHDPIRPGKAD